RLLHAGRLERGRGTHQALRQVAEAGTRRRQRPRVFARPEQRSIGAEARVRSLTTSAAAGTRSARSASGSPATGTSSAVPGSRDTTWRILLSSPAAPG